MTGWADGAPPTLHNPIDYAELRSTIQRMKDEQHTMRGAAESADWLVAVTVNSRGCLTELDLDDGIYRQPDAVALAESIIATARRATITITRS